MSSAEKQNEFQLTQLSTRSNASKKVKKGQKSIHAQRVCCFAQGVTHKTVFKVFLDVSLTFIDYGFDIFLTYTFFKAQHSKWGTASIVVILLPGITCTVAQCIQDNTNREANRSWTRNFTWRGFGKVVVTLFCYPLWVLILGYQTLARIPDPRMMVHVKVWEGLLESSWQFLIQVVLFQFRTPIGHKIPFGLVYIPNGEFWFRVAGIVLSFCAFLYTVTEYHILLDGKVSQHKRQLKLAPFFTVNFLFRSLTLSLFWVYWKVPALIACVPLWLSNMWLTRKTLLSDLPDRANQHLTFCWVVGGMVSQLTPALALFYGQTANKKTINYFYRRNIRINNFLLLSIFSLLVLHLNLNPDDGSLLNRNVLLGCHKTGDPYSMDEFGIYDIEHFQQVNSTTHQLEIFGTNWTVREATSSEYQTPTDKNSTEYLYRPLYFIAHDCQPGQSPVEMFNYVAVPVIYGLGIISTLTSFCTFHMD
eukprot:GFUD01008444.1.p1 GENE.GFUD01008444.1~~GFUD01008444.1.p1  ORF type:complete len:475 (-),score=107.10 GFUD01008444.1:89-1513(-)